VLRTLGQPLRTPVPRSSPLRPATAGTGCSFAAGCRRCHSPPRRLRRSNGRSALELQDQSRTGRCSNVAVNSLSVCGMPEMAPSRRRSTPANGKRRARVLGCHAGVESDALPADVGSDRPLLARRVVRGPQAQPSDGLPRHHDVAENAIVVVVVRKLGTRDAVERERQLVRAIGELAPTLLPRCRRRSPASRSASGAVRTSGR